MKKVFSLALAFVLAFALAIPAFAALPESTHQITQTNAIPTENNDAGTPADFTDEERDTLITYDVSGNYIVTIPAAITLTWTQVDAAVVSGKQTLKAENVLIPYNYELNVTLSGTRQLTYSVIEEGNPVVKDAVDFKIYDATSEGAIDENAEIANGKVLVVNGGGVNTVKADNEGGGSSSGTEYFFIKTTDLPRYNQRYTCTLTFDITVDQYVAP